MNKKLKRFLSALIVSTVLSSNFTVLAHSSAQQIEEESQSLNNKKSNLEEMQVKIDELSEVIRNLDLSIEEEQLEINKIINENNELKKSIRNFENEILDLLSERENNKELYEVILNKIDSYELSKATEKSFLDKINNQYTVVQGEIEEIVRKKILKKDGLEKDTLEKENRIIASKNLVSKFEEERYTKEIQLKDFQVKKEIIIVDIKKTEQAVDDIMRKMNNESIAQNTEVNITRIISGIELLSKKINEIYKHTIKQSESTKKVAITIKNVVKNVESVSQSTQSINDNVNEQIAVIEEIGATSSNLYSMTEKLNKLIEYFKI